MSKQISKFSQQTQDELGFYVYVYSDPDTKMPFYIGKGIGNRVFNHSEQDSNPDLADKLAELAQSGKEPVIDLLAYGLTDQESKIVEAACIDLVGLEYLTNQIRGNETKEYGRENVSFVEAKFSGAKIKPEDFNEPTLLIRINQMYSSDLEPQQLYEATRGYWKVSLDRARNIKYVAAVFHGIIVEMYQVQDWFQGGSTQMFTREEDEEFAQNRYEFVGKVAPAEVSAKYVGKSVEDFFSQGDQNPIHYVD